MKLPISDKFLWDLYRFLEKTGDIQDIFAARTWQEAWSPELYKWRCEYRKKQDKKSFGRLIYYLKKKGYIKIKNLKEKQAVLITKNGADKIFRIRLKTTEKKKRVDGKWEMVIFDIPERKRHLRALFRENLHFLGYKMFQQSVWISPYNVLKETEEIIRRYSFDPYVKIFLIEKI